ncbi:hypothetical protein ABL78_1886 [Leptomonas seymouri]|uniref:Uncharacterized protein n=1 Tax=Leptomonas seymouri TaxID=5684 RepID=A0A0N1I8A1_LEPSE|nr:hypothetical protein ABL78_1886 [Leptomonas seymouri]|eukprot:KPI89002.1 hypothetical protein ABL78_1886 [Leptomonas seymouri]
MNIQISGNLSGPTAIFLAGWPDTCDVFRENIMAALAADYRIVGITLPSFDDGHPFLQTLREKGLCSSFGGPRSSDDANKKSPSNSCSGSSWLPRFFPFSSIRSVSAKARAAEVGSAYHANSLHISCRRPPLEMFRTTWKGHSFEDLVTMLEVAVDTAMETCNYCPSTVPSMSAATAASVRRKRDPEAVSASPTKIVRVAENSDDGLDEVPLHQLPPTYIRPVLIAHDWGCSLAYELLLVRPNFFSRIVALDVGAYVFESNAPHVERMCGLVSRSEKGRAASSSSFVARFAQTPEVTLRDTPEPTPWASLGNARTLNRSLPTRDVKGEIGDGFSKSIRPVHELKRSTEMPDVGQERERSADTAEAAAKSNPFRLQHSQNSNINTPQETQVSSPMTIVHGVAPSTYNNHGSFNAPMRFDTLSSSVSNASQIRNSVSGGATKRSLASQYAIRRRKPAKQTQRAERRKGIAIAFYQLVIIVCQLLIPYRLARWLVGCFVSLSGRPTYCYDPQIVSTPTVELLNHTLNAQFFAQYPYALENRGAFDLQVLLQIQGAAGVGERPGDGSVSLLKSERSSPMQGKPSLRLLPGWKVLLIPYVEVSPVPVEAAKIASALAAVGQQNRRPPFTSSAFLRCSAHCQKFESVGMTPRAGGNGHAFRSRTQHRSTHCENSNPCSLCSGSTISADFSQDDMLSPLQAAGQQQQEELGYAAWNSTSAATTTDASYTIYSSYAKGAGLFEEWNTSVEVLGRTNASAAPSGELDPYLSARTIPDPQWVAEDPLMLTGAQSFQENCRWGGCANEAPYLIAPDWDGTAGRSAGSPAASSPSASHMQVVKRKIFYQAVAFPPLAQPTSVTSSLNSDHNSHSLANNDDATSSRSTHSTMLGRLRRSQRKAALRPSVPVVASPRQGWIYLRYWLGTALMLLMAFGSWLFARKRPAPASGAGEGGSNNSSKAYSNVMTTAMTTIYRRLPATPSLAASTANLPGDGDVVLQPKGYGPLVTHRYFVPIPVPILFMYGGEKKVMLHADHWCAYIRQYQRPRDGISDVVEVQGGGHWFFAEKKYQKKVADRIAEFLAAEQVSPLGL